METESEAKVSEKVEYFLSKVDEMLEAESGEIKNYSEEYPFISLQIEDAIMAVFGEPLKIQGDLEKSDRFVLRDQVKIVHRDGEKYVAQVWYFKRWA